MKHDKRLDAEHRRRIDAMPAAAIGEELWLLRVERFEADTIGLSQWAAYISDLEDEIAACVHEIIRASVTEIALLRAEATGALLG